MEIDDSESQIRRKLINQLNLNMIMDHGSWIMDHARADVKFMSRVVSTLEECGIDDRTEEENALLEWARSFLRLRVTGYVR
jgi:hypothetical protein